MKLKRYALFVPSFFAILMLLVFDFGTILAQRNAQPDRCPGTSGYDQTIEQRFVRLDGNDRRHVYSSKTD